MQNKKVNIRKIIASFNDPFETRRWIVEEVKGIGYKEASHFLRNISKGTNLAILDRHILKNLKRLGVPDSLPASMSEKKYLEIEERMRKFSQKSGIQMGHLDFVLWYYETGNVFK